MKSALTYSTLRQTSSSSAIWSLIALVLLVVLRPVDLLAQADSADYLKELKGQLKTEWPGNRTINLVFHGHSVPSGYFKTPLVSTLDSYPYQLLSELKKEYPYAVINVIITAIGGENAESGLKRFEQDVLIHKPDVLFIDYALNDRGIGLERARAAWESMIRMALERNIKVILMSPSPDQQVNLLEPGNILEMHAAQIRDMAAKYNIGFGDSYEAFRRVVKAGNPLPEYMSQVNHPNRKGHNLIMLEVLKYFK